MHVPFHSVKLELDFEQLYNIHTVGENIIATIKIRNNFCYPL